MTETDIVIIGGGLTGLTAALHARRHGATVTLCESGLPGGLVANVGHLEGYPSVAPSSGTDLAASLVDQCRRSGVQLREDTVQSISAGDEVRGVVTESGPITTGRVVLATGARLKQLGVPGEDTLQGRGVSQCAFCDAGLYKGRDVAVVGGGDGAFQEALHLAQYAAGVTMIMRGDRPRARRTAVLRAADNEKFAFVWDAEVLAIEGEDAVEGLRIRRDGKTESLACAGVFVFIGVAPASDLAPDAVERDALGAVVTDDRLETAVPGLFAAGAVRAGYRGQLTHAAAEGTTAAISAAAGL